MRNRRQKTYFLGKDICEKIIRGLRGYPIVIVSGLALGIDSISHEAALSVGLKTLAFPGSGLTDNVLYPSTRRQLAKRIVASGGALLSPFTSNQEGARWTFPFRNRLMAGISHATLVIEARKDSGTLITAEHAAAFSREVLAVPGSVFSELSYGPHMLLRQGATAVTCSEDVLEALGFDIPHEEENKNGDQKKEGKPAPRIPRLIELSFSPEEKNIVERLSAPKSRDDLIREMGASPSSVNAALIGLELRGIVKEQNGSLILL